MSRKRVVIAGGGYAGLAAAHRMQKTIAFETTELFMKSQWVILHQRTLSMI